MGERRRPTILHRAESASLHAIQPESVRFPALLKPASTEGSRRIVSERWHLEELIERNWGLHGPFAIRAVREEPYRRSWWADTRHGPVMVKWFGDPGRRELIESSLRLARWSAEQGAPVVQIIARRTGGDSIVVNDGVLAVFEYVDGAVGAGNWRALGRAVAHLHTLEVPEFAERSPAAPARALPEAYRSLRGFDAEGDIADRISRALALLRELPQTFDVSTGMVHADIGIAHTLTRTTGEIVFLDTLDIGIGPLILDFPPILCEHLSHFNSAGEADRLDSAAAGEFLEEYERVRPISASERAAMIDLHRSYMVMRAARALDEARRSGSLDLLERARHYFRWLEYVEEMVPRDLAPLLS